MAKKNKTDVLVVGGGASGVCAAIQAARLGVDVVIVEETTWLGGMLTAAGVSAIDGNHKLPSGLWGEFRQKLYDYYGGAEKVETGWVSNTLFEPRVGYEILLQMVNRESNISIKFGYWLKKVIKEENTVIACIFENENNDSLIIEAGISIDATEYGDLIAMAGCEYRIGREAREEYNEQSAPQKPDEYIQDLTYVAILKEYLNDDSHLLAKPKNYNPEIFLGCCKEWSKPGGSNKADARQMLNYGRLPNNKYMINWPIHGNDYYLNIIENSRGQRLKSLEKAKSHTLSFVYFIQNQLQMSNVGLCDDEFPTKDKLALIPYIRESRRIKGLTTLTLNDIIDLYQSPQGELYQNGIAVGNYPLDHHHEQVRLSEKENFPEISAFNIPFGCLVPKKVKGILAAEKNISVTHQVNGCSRLQPVVMLIGQAAGAAAALCIKKDIQPDKLVIKELQQNLIKANCWLMPFTDVNSDDWFFQSLQRSAVCGLIKGQPEKKDWVNEFYFYPEKKVNRSDVTLAMDQLVKVKNKDHFDQIVFESDSISTAELIKCFWIHSDKNQFIKSCNSQENEAEILDRAIDYLKSAKTEPGIEKYFSNINDVCTRKMFVYILDKLFDLFEIK